MTTKPANQSANPPAIDFTRYRVLVAGEFSTSFKQWAGLTELGVRVTVVGMAPPSVRHGIQKFPLEECFFFEDQSALAAEAYARWPAADLVILIGGQAAFLEATLLPWMEEAAASSMQPLLPIVRLDDPALRFLRTGEQWAFFLLGRTLGLGVRRAREFMEECCGYPKQNR